MREVVEGKVYETGDYNIYYCTVDSEADSGATDLDDLSCIHFRRKLI